ncbi:MAG: ATPase, T2SS/T4P/T4SS family [Cyanobacteria bacterium P01_G01_bin.49]
MPDNQDKQPIDYDATIVGEESPHFPGADVPNSVEETSSPKNRAVGQEAPSSAAVVTLVNKFLAKAVEKKATQIEIEPEENLLSIRYFQEDQFNPVIDPLPKKFTTAVISRLKQMAALDIQQNPTPQKGRICKRGGGRAIDFFVQAQPSMYDEKLIIRVVDSAVKPPHLTQLIEDDRIRQSLEQMSNHESGLFLITSSQPKDLSPLLYSVLFQETLNHQKIATIEESITRLLPGITQIEVDPDREQDYPDVLQSLLRQDKQKIMVDRLPNPSVARMVVEMARNDHFILSSLRAKDAISAIALLSQMVTPQLLADALIGVVHQHTIRRLCPTCRQVHQPTQRELEQFGIDQAKAAEVTFYQACHLSESEIEQARQKGKLCQQCKGEGYHGEIQVYELLQGTPDLKKAIAQQASLEEMKQASLQPEKTSPLMTALEFVYQGQTSLTEVARLFPDSLLVINHEMMTDTSTDLTQRLEKVEQLLMSLTEEFIQLKQALNPTPPAAKDFSQETTEAFKETYIAEELPQSMDLSKETITAESGFYEELTDPGEWEKLKKELDPSKETMVVDFLPEEETTIPQEDNPFKSIPDPWS